MLVEDFGLRVVERPSRSSEAIAEPAPRPVPDPQPEPVPASAPVPEAVAEAEAVAVEVAGPATIVDAPGRIGAVVWTGSAPRGPELQRFIDHLSELRAVGRSSLT